VVRTVGLIPGLHRPAGLGLKSIFRSWPWATAIPIDKHKIRHDIAVFIVLSLSFLCVPSTTLAWKPIRCGLPLLDYLSTPSHELLPTWCGTAQPAAMYSMSNV